MNVLVDTHAVLWWLAEDKQLSKKARRILESPSNRRYVSLVTLWEIALKMSSGRLPTKGLALGEIADALVEQEFVLLPVRLADLLRLERLPELHRDPFDRLLIAQALEEGVALLTVDAAIRGYAVQTIW